MKKEKKKLGKDTIDKCVTRRDFIKNTGKAVGIAALGINIVGCDGSDDSSSGVFTPGGSTPGGSTPGGSASGGSGGEIGPNS